MLTKREEKQLLKKFQRAYRMPSKRLKKVI